MARLDSQTAAGRPAIVMVTGVDQPGYAFLGNAPHFGLPFLACFAVPNQMLAPIAALLVGLWKQHQAGAVIEPGVQAEIEGRQGKLKFVLVAPPQEEQEIMKSVDFGPAGKRWPDAPVLELRVAPLKRTLH